MKKKRCLIMTGTIDANGDLERRREEYLKAIAFYGIHLNADIFFIENSPYPLYDDEEFMALVERYHIKIRKMEREKDEQKGKGFQEFSMLDRITEELIGKYESFAKVTGRYLIKNISSLYGSTCEDMVIDRHRKMVVAITGFFICDISFYRNNIAGLYKKADDSRGKFIEHILYQATQGKPGVRLFRINPRYSGRSGSYGGSLHRNPLKMKVRNLERIALKLLKRNEFLIEY